MFTQPQTVWRSPDMQKPDSYIISMYCSPRINARAFAPARGRWPHRLSWEAPLRTEWGSFGGQKTPKNLCILEIAVFYVFPSSLLYHSISFWRSEEFWAGLKGDVVPFPACWRWRPRGRPWLQRGYPAGAVTARAQRGRTLQNGWLR